MVLCAGHVGLSDTSERGCPYTSCRVRHPNLLAALEASPGPTTGPSPGDARFARALVLPARPREQP